MTDSALYYAKVIGDLNARWTPHPDQQRILYALFALLEPLVFNESGRKFGKTEIIAYFLWRRALTVPGGHYYFAPEQKQAKEIFWATGRLQEFGPQEYLDGQPNNTEMRMRFTNGSFIKVDGSDNFNAYRGVEPHTAVYDEFRDFRPEFHKAMGPNLGVYKAPLLICSTPPEQMELEHYDAMKVGLTPGKNYFNFPSWANPHMDKEWLEKEKTKLYARGEGDVWEREYGAKRVRGGSNAIFPMFDAPTKEKPLTKHVRPHQEVMDAVLRDKKKLHWQVICDPGNSTVFCVLFRAINPYTRKVYRLAEIYETSQAETSTSKIVPRIQKMREELCPAYEAYGIEWEQYYDEAATWFAVEAENSFDETFTPTTKAMANIDEGLSLLKDQMLHGLTVISDRCKDLIKEYANFLRDPATGKPRKDCADHAIDCDRYGNDLAGIDLRPEQEPPEQDPDDLPRFRTPEQDLDDDRDFDDFNGLEDF